MRCPHCGEDRQVERTDRHSIYSIGQSPLYVWFCNVCGREYIAPPWDDVGSHRVIPWGDPKRVGRS